VNGRGAIDGLPRGDVMSVDPWAAARTACLRLAESTRAGFLNHGHGIFLNRETSLDLLLEEGWLPGICAALHVTNKAGPCLVPKFGTMQKEDSPSH